MPIFDLYSKRQKRAAQTAPDVYTYDDLPRALRVQIVHIWNDSLGLPNKDQVGNIADTYYMILGILRREYGVFRFSEMTLDAHDASYAYDELLEFFMKCKPNQALDAVEVSFRAIDRIARQWNYRHRQDSEESADNAINELNERFKEHGIGYFYSDGTVGRVDSEFVHADIVKPTLVILRRKEFANAQTEFLSAHTHYREGKNSAALIDCYKAFESTMKIICSKRHWAFDQAKGAADLVRVCMENGLIPQYWQSHFNGLRSVLESAIPTPRNKQAGHGAGSQLSAPIPDELASYVLHMTAATIFFLAEAERKRS